MVNSVLGMNGKANLIAREFFLLNSQPILATISAHNMYSKRSFRFDGQFRRLVMKSRWKAVNRPLIGIKSAFLFPEIHLIA